MDLVQTIRKEGSRGGRGEFKWEDVKNDSHRENYLGHSLMAPVGRWQQGRDLSWYAKGDGEDGGEQTEAQKRREEIRKVKEAEEAAMATALGLPHPSKNPNMAPLGPSKVQDKHPRLEAKDADRERHRSANTEHSRKRRRDSREREGDHRRDKYRRSRSPRERREHRDVHTGRQNRDKDRSQRVRSRSPDRDRRDRRRFSRSRSGERHSHRRQRREESAHRSWRKRRRGELDSDSQATSPSPPPRTRTGERSDRRGSDSYHRRSDHDRDDNRRYR